MASTESIIHHILKTTSIVDYLAQKGFHPIKFLPGGKLSYLCPMPGHNEKKPSFIVYTNQEFQNFYCYGCQSQYNIIHLVSRLEGISYKEAASRLGAGVEITENDEFSFWVDKIGSKSRDEGQKLSEVMLILSFFCYYYLSSVNFDAEECEMVDQFWEKIDTELYEYEFDRIEQTPEVLRSLLKKRRSKFAKKKRDQEKERYIRESESSNFSSVS